MTDQLFKQSNGLAGYKETPAVDRDVVAINYSAPQTSIDAGLDALPKSGRQRHWIYDIITRTSRRVDITGATADEIQMWTGLPIQSVSARINGLANDGLVIDSGIRRRTRNGRRAICWITTI